MYMLNFIHSHRSTRNAFALTCDADGREVREKKIVQREEELASQCVNIF